MTDYCYHESYIGVNWKNKRGYYLILAILHRRYPAIGND